MLTLLTATLALLPPQDPPTTGSGDAKPAATRRPTDRERLREADWPDDAPGRQVAIDRDSGREFKWLPMVGADYATPAAVVERGRVTDEDLVIGLVVGGRAFAYPINMLGGPQREIVNDAHGGTRFCVNW